MFVCYHHKLATKTTFILTITTRKTVLLVLEVVYWAFGLASPVYGTLIWQLGDVFGPSLPSSQEKMDDNQKGKGGGGEKLSKSIEQQQNAQRRVLRKKYAKPWRQHKRQRRRWEEETFRCQQEFLSRSLKLYQHSAPWFGGKDQVDFWREDLFRAYCVKLIMGLKDREKILCEDFCALGASSDKKWLVPSRLISAGCSVLCRETNALWNHSNHYSNFFTSASQKWLEVQESEWRWVRGST